VCSLDPLAPPGVVAIPPIFRLPDTPAGGKEVALDDFAAAPALALATAERRQIGPNGHDGRSGRFPRSRQETPRSQAKHLLTNSEVGDP
jgi:hypothetical protein